MSTRLNDFNRFLTDHGARAFDQLAAGRAAAGMVAGAEATLIDVSPLDRLAAQWSLLTADEKAKVLKRIASPGAGRSRARRKPRPRTAAPSRIVGTPPAEAKAKKAKAVPDQKPDEKKKKKEAKKAKKEAKKAKKEAKKNAKAKAKEESKLRREAKKEQKAREKKTRKTREKKGAKKEKESALIHQPE